MTRYWIEHQDDAGEWWSLGEDPYEADTAEEGLTAMLRDSGAEDDGRYRVYEAEYREG